MAKTATKHAATEHTRPGGKRGPSSRRSKAAGDARVKVKAKAAPAASGKQALGRADSEPPKSEAASGRQRKTPNTKSEKVLQALRLGGGASIADLSALTGWQAHSVRGFLSGTVRKTLGLVLVSARDADGVRRYRIADGNKA